MPTTYDTTLKEYTASAWIGIDGSNCNNLWQAGVDSIIEKNSDESFYAWYEWYPAATEVVDLGVLKGGDVSCSFQDSSLSLFVFPFFL